MVGFPALFEVTSSMSVGLQCQRRKLTSSGPGPLGPDAELTVTAGKVAKRRWPDGRHLLRIDEIFGVMVMGNPDGMVGFPKRSLR
jgi:hypothetical protein